MYKYKTPYWRCYNSIFPLSLFIFSDSLRVTIVPWFMFNSSIASLKAVISRFLVCSSTIDSLTCIGIRKPFCITATKSTSRPFLVGTLQWNCRHDFTGKMVNDNTDMNRPNMPMVPFPIDNRNYAIMRKYLPE